MQLLIRYVKDRLNGILLIFAGDGLNSNKNILKQQKVHYGDVCIELIQLSFTPNSNLQTLVKELVCRWLALSNEVYFDYLLMNNEQADLKIIY